MFDLVIRGGRVLDGTGAAAYPADIGVRDGRIAAMGDLSAADAPSMDAASRLVCPGFVDTHSHADSTVLTTEVQQALLRQGVTTVILGQDGLSYAPANPAALSFVSRYFAAINGEHPDLDGGPLSVAELMATWHGRTAVNTAYLVPHGTVRFSVLGGAHRTPSDDELAAMTRIVERGLADGAVGLSSGLEYVPGRYAAVAELAALCAPIAAAGLPYVTHMRGYGEAAPRGFAEARAIADAGGVALHVSHVHGPARVLLPLLDAAIGDGIDVSVDSYPYQRGCTILAMMALPHWLQDADLDRVVARLSEPDTRAAVLAELDPGLWPRVTVAHAPGFRWAEGLSLPAAAAQAGLDIGPFLLDLLIGTGLQASAVVQAPASTDEESARAIMRSAVHMGGSDGIYVGSHPHPRGWGTFARYLARHVVALGDWTWPDAAVHLAARPAKRFGLTDRGHLQVGFAADLVLIDPDRVADGATYDEPRTLAHGVSDVFVNGVSVLVDGALTGAHPGISLSPHSGR